MQVTQSTTTTLEDIRAKTPPGQVAMFRVTSLSASSMADDWIVGENVWVTRKGMVRDFFSNDDLCPVRDVGLHFISYIDR